MQRPNNSSASSAGREANFLIAPLSVTRGAADPGGRQFGSDSQLEVA